jgi:hypothetical protein
MQPRYIRHWFCLFIVAISCAASAQKVKVGYDKGADFSTYKTYSYADPSVKPLYPLLYATVMDSIDKNLRAKGFRPVDKNGDLTVVTSGGIGFANAASGGTPVVSTSTGPPPSINSTMWTGAEGQGQLMGALADGTLELQFVDRKSNQMVWSGTVSQNLDIEQKKKSLQLATKAVDKLMKNFPPKSGR